ncbi:tRNA (adenosine(37)-N6)-dimethylallyltransferase MiaA [Halobacillus sp. A1]|uniref:tRNA (adenosine(37)-N6)-dimethylallyltransferase MiaA n=1 Tax=Halobacillus sp. A1 TaxID=2880262 RepID=UPI0020A6BF42|nr:tRNA (adenosine(37)-N6)-dimethylallyltransferase MiaA [Halobacillus sp. A1]MCP3031277.1 tRNA (adenosine(37)-N6)-dimethylallyltransferase MiaA [Halobacillus sp. A1]
MKPSVVSVVGPTAVGKSELAVKIAETFNGEIISGDSMQIYRRMDIGTAKITKEEMRGIPHHMIDIKDPEESFSVAEFQLNVRSLIEEITNRNRLPIIVGGTGLYIQAALYDFNFSDHERDRTIYRVLEKEAAERGIDAIYQRLKEVDPKQADKIHPNNERRVLRALEVYEKTGQTMSDYQADQKGDSPFTPILIGLEMGRTELYERINYRVDLMIEQGLEAEVRSLFEEGLENSQSMKAIGYKEFIPYFKGEYTYERAIELLKRNSRRYAKRQFTYFRNKLNVNWYAVQPNEKNDKIEKILRDLAGMLEET